MIHLTKYKLFESTKLSIDNLDLIEIESCIIEHIDSGEIEITDYSEHQRFQTHNVNMNLRKFIYFYKLSDVPRPAISSFNYIVGRRCIAIRVKLLDYSHMKDKYNKYSIKEDWPGYTRETLKSIFSLVERRYNIEVYFWLNFYESISSDSFIFLVEKKIEK
jgi:hypothetical protein